MEGEKVVYMRRLGYSQDFRKVRAKKANVVTPTASSRCLPQGMAATHTNKRT